MRKQIAIALAALGGAITGSTHAVPMVGVTGNNTLIGFDSTNPAQLTFGKPISGLAENEVVRGIDYRPTTGELYALGSFGNLYTLNAGGVGSAPATLKFNLNAAPTLAAAGGLSGSSFGFDFNPQADPLGNPSLRIVSNTGQNLAVNVNTGAVVVATPTFYPSGGATNAVGQAYTNSAPGGTTAANPTQQFAIDSGNDSLVLQAFNAGTLTVVGALGINTTSDVGFDIYTPAIGTNIGYATLVPTNGNVSHLYEINLTTGAAIDLGQIDGGVLVPNFAVTPIPEPVTLGLVALAAPAMLLRRRR